MKTQSLYAVAALAASTFAAPQHGGEPHNRLREKHTTGELVGDGSPRQAYLYKQVTKNIHCGGEDESCGATKADIETYTISVDVGVTLGGWFSAGAGVSKSVGTSESANCNAGSGDSTANVVCVWARVAHTGWEIQDWIHESGDSPEDGEKKGDPYWIWTPNEEAGHGMVCAHDGECQDRENEWWGYMSKGDNLWSAVSNKGGPQEYVWGSDPENRWN